MDSNSVRKTLRNLTLVWFFGYALLIQVGCSTIEEPAAYNPSALTVSHEQSGLVVKVDPMRDPHQIKTYFGINLLNRGILPVYVHVQNNEEEAVVVEPNIFRLAIGETSPAQSEERSLRGGDAGATIATAGGLLLSAPMMLMGGKMQTDAMTVNYNYNQKQLKTATLTDGDSGAGFIYFQLPDRNVLSKPITIHATFTGMESGETMTFIFKNLL